MLGYAYLRKNIWKRFNPTTDDPVVRAALERSLALDARNLHALIVYLNLAMMEQDWDAARRYVARMKDINPHDVTVARGLGLYYQTLGFPEQAVDAFRQATRLDPLSAVAWGSLAVASAVNQRNDEAIAAGEAALALEPQSTGVLAWVCIAHAMKGDLHEAETIAVKIEQMPGGSQFKGCAIEIARAAGDLEKARRLVDDRVKNEQGDAGSWGQNYLEVGGYKKALPFLRRAYDEGDISLYAFTVDPIMPRDFLEGAGWKALTQLPRFRAWQAAHDKLAAELAAR
jgi:Flp pilus assembly protein TadD